MRQVKPRAGGASVAAPLALVYRGPASCSGCSEAVAELLASANHHFAVRYIGPGESLKLTAANLAAAALYAQPGGNGTLEQAYRQLQPAAEAIAAYVSGGGRYLGICMGGYLAGATPGFGLLPGDTDQYIASPGAGVATDADTLVQVTWAGQVRTMYFQDGPFFILDPTRPAAASAAVVARYSNQEIAALVASFGSGKVGVVGPHPEATAAWYAAYNLVDPDGPDADLGHALIDLLMN